MYDNHVALWAGVYSFFATILAIGAINIFDPEDRVRFVGGIVVGFITGGGVYAKQKLADAKAGRIVAGTLVVTETDEKKVYSLELSRDPTKLDNKQEVVFKVRRD